MPRIACLVDTPTLADRIEGHLSLYRCEIQFFSTASLNRTIRQHLRSLSPDLIVFELSQILDNLHFYFFLRADASFRTTPIVLITEDHHLSEQASSLNADGVLSPFDIHRLPSLLPFETSEPRSSLAVA